MKPQTDPSGHTMGALKWHTKSSAQGTINYIKNFRLASSASSFKYKIQTLFSEAKFAATPESLFYIIGRLIARL